MEKQMQEREREEQERQERERREQLKRELERQERELQEQQRRQREQILQRQREREEREREEREKEERERRAQEAKLVPKVDPEVPKSGKSEPETASRPPALLLHNPVAPPRTTSRTSPRKQDLTAGSPSPSSPSPSPSPATKSVPLVSPRTTSLRVLHSTPSSPAESTPPSFDKPAGPSPLGALAAFAPSSGGGGRRGKKEEAARETEDQEMEKWLRENSHLSNLSSPEEPPKPPSPLPRPAGAPAFAPRRNIRVARQTLMVYSTQGTSSSPDSPSASSPQRARNMRARVRPQSMMVRGTFQEQQGKFSRDFEVDKSSYQIDLIVRVLFFLTFFNFFLKLFLTFFYKVCTR
jgi:hypothetical protein